MLLSRRGATPSSPKGALTPAPPQLWASPCPSSRSCGPRPEARPPRTLLRPPVAALRSCETRCPRGPNIDTSLPCPGPNLAAGGGGADLCLLRGPRPLRWPQRRRREVYLVLSRKGVRSRCDSSAEPAGSAPGAKELPLRVSAASGARVRAACSGRCLRLSRAALRCGSSCRCHQPEGAGLTGAGPGPSCPAPSSGGKAERPRDSGGCQK